MRVTLFVLSSISAITRIAASTLPIPVSEEAPPIIKSAVDPVVESAIEPLIEPVIEPVVESIITPDIESVVDPVIEPVVKPVVEPIVEPIIEPVIDAAIEQEVEPVTEQAAERIEPVVEPIIEPNVESAIEPVIGSYVEPDAEQAVEPVVDPIIEQVVEPVVEPTIEPAAETIAELIAETIVDPIIDPIVDQIPVPEIPSRISTGVIPEDLKNAMQGIQSLASDLILQAYNIRGDGVKVQIIGNTYLRCQDMINEFQEMSSKISRPPTKLFGWEDQGSICSTFDAFGINQSKLITVLSMEPRSIIRDGFGDRFQQCFDQLQPVLNLFIKQLIIYTPTCEAEMLRRIDQLDVAFSNAKLRMEAARQS